MKRRRILLGLLVVILVGSALLVTWAIRATPTVRNTVVDALNSRFDSKVDLQSLKVSIYPTPQVTGSGLTLRHNGRTDVPPLITIDSFDASASLKGLIRKPLHLKDVKVEGLNIHVPPGGLNPHDAADDEEPRKPKDTPPLAIVATPPPPSKVLIDSIHAKRARLEIASRRANRLPRVFDIENLVMRGFGRAEGAEFHAGLINPIPRGRIETSGNFGPWNGDEPDLTPLKGEYAFKNANLDDIKGIGGTLSSVGTYAGVLQRVDVEGQTETPNFSIDIAGHQVPLRTRFKAVVDGTNGDTWLERVDAQLSHTTIVARGAVVRTRNVKGRRVSLDLQIERGYIEDLLRLAVKTTNPMLGTINMKTKFLLPEGEADVIDRLQLDGTFSLAQAKFTNFDVQRKINLLSSRGRGDENDDGTGQSVVSNLEGKFVLRDAKLTFSSLRFLVPGAIVELSGTYGLRSEQIDFKGYFLTDATLADMTHGMKALVARLAQPFFRRPGGGSKIPIRISGPRSNPQFGLDTGRILNKG
jgi:AsmA-like C-terminal region/AsmA family